MIKMTFLVVGGFLILGILADVQSTFAATCTITTYNEDLIKDAEKNCATITLNGISVPAGVTLDLNLNEGTKLIFQGTITWEFFQWNGPLVNLTGTNVEISGAPDHLLDVRGNLWWDGKGEGGAIIKPVSFVVHRLKNSIIRDINIKNPSYHAIWIEESHGVIAQDVYVDSIDGDTLGGKNTDGFNVWTSNNVTIQRIRVYNQDDCVAIKSGTNIVVKDSYCSGGHGLSIGSVGGRDYNIVENVSVSNIEIVDSDNGVRIKTNYGTTGSVTNVTYENVTLKDINKYGIRVHGDYGSHDGIATGGVPVKEFNLKNITGTVKETGVNIHIFVKNASDWHWTDVNVTGGKVIKECDGIPEDSGISCY
ncbi:endopolygalacturonase I-like isoform X1 [Anoplophora glabripennis]|uniref:endopolygalacturonase I-like isoform X1 n=1 Tax=Anoplophora glabripennis TaxID=217634 RepID=UPI000873578A|nr:endopolygalacturonase I-like isoform X1 [Anoplophora glabripennis]